MNSDPNNFISIKKKDVYYIKYRLANIYYYLSIPTIVYSEKNGDIEFFKDKEWRCVYNRTMLKGMGNFQCNHRK